MSGIREVMLVPEKSSVCGMSQDLTAKSFLSGDHLSEGCESGSQVKCEIDVFTDINSTACDETPNSLHSNESSDQLIDPSKADLKQEHLVESSSCFTFPMSSLSCNTESSSTSIPSTIKNETDKNRYHDSCDKLVLMERSAEGNSLLDIKVEDESDSETSELTGAERSFQLGMTSSNQSSNCSVQYNRCPACRTIFSKFEYLQRHIQHRHLNEGQHRCSQCGKIYYNLRYLTRHIKRAHTADAGNLTSHILTHLEEKHHRCSQCEECFSEESHLMEHTTSVHNLVQPNGSYNMEFSELESHDVLFGSVHCGEKSYSCDLCDYKCLRKCYLTRHQKTDHVGAKGHQCAECDYKGLTKNFLKRHWLAVHCQYKPHSCTECDQAFSLPSDLKKHVDAVHRGRKPHACNECDRTFALNSGLKKHVKAVHRKERPHSCLVCSKNFITRSDVRKHVITVHIGCKPYRCQHCSKGFLRKSQFSNHVTALHQQINASAPS